MPELWIDNQRVDVPEGSSVLEAARQLGVEIPTLCHLRGCEPSTSCFVCVVRVDEHENPVGPARGLVPSCATLARAGMHVQSETAEVHAARKAALELLMGDHLGDCRGPCHTGCPAGMNIPRMIRQIIAGDMGGAIATVKADIPLGAVLGRICPAPCEKVCRRKFHDAAVSVCLLKRFVADWDLAQPQPYLPPRRPPTGKRVAVVGAGPAGLSAAYYLLCDGHEVSVLDDHDRAGGMLRYGLMAEQGGQDRLPPTVLEAEAAVIERMGAKFEFGRKVFHDIPADELRQQFDAVVFATGAMDPIGAELLRAQEQAAAPAGQARLFAAGGAAGHGGRMAVRALADGHAAAGKVSRYLAGVTKEPAKVFNCRMGTPLPEELKKFLANASDSARIEPAAAGFTRTEAVAESLRCLHCDCRKAGDEHAPSYPCKLRHWAQVYGVASAHRGQAAAKVEGSLNPGRVFEQLDHPQVIYESGKCIACGLCIQIAAKEGEKVGLTFIGRGFDVRVGVPFDKPLAEALTRSALACAEACPTGAISVK
jgi:ferredoxin